MNIFAVFGVFIQHLGVLRKIDDYRNLLKLYALANKDMQFQQKFAYPFSLPEVLQYQHFGDCFIFTDKKKLPWFTVWIAEFYSFYGVEGVKNARLLFVPIRNATMYLIGGYHHTISEPSKEISAPSDIYAY